MISVLQFIYDNTGVCRVGTPSPITAKVLAATTERQDVEDDGKLAWSVPRGNRDQNKLNVARRTCGYGTQFWNQGLTIIADQGSRRICDELRNNQVLRHC